MKDTTDLAPRVDVIQMIVKDRMLVGKKRRMWDRFFSRTPHERHYPFFPLNSFPNPRLVHIHVSRVSSFNGGSSIAHSPGNVGNRSSAKICQ